MASIPNYNSGFANGLAIRGVPISVTNPGKTWWLSNATTLVKGDRGGSDANKGTYNSPFSTLAGAVTAIAADGGANRGDILMVKPGHAESITSSTALTLSVAGLAIIGLGSGANRPTFTISTANTATINVSAANVSVVNCVVTANFLSIAAAFTLSTAKNFTLQGVLFNETSSVLDFLNCVKSTGAANTVDGLTITDSQWAGLGTTSVNSFVLSANDIDRLTLARNFVILNRTADASILATITAGVLTNAVVDDNVVISQQTATTAGSLINVGGTTSTGVVRRNYAGTLTTTSDKLFTTTVGLYPFENRVSGVVGATGFVIPAVDS